MHSKLGVQYTYYSSVSFVGKTLYIISSCLTKESYFWRGDIVYMHSISYFHISNMSWERCRAFSCQFV